MVSFYTFRFYDKVHCHAFLDLLDSTMKQLSLLQSLTTFISNDTHAASKHIAKRVWITIEDRSTFPFSLSLSMASYGYHFFHSLNQNVLSLVFFLTYMYASTM
jgi:hypothetical protein